MLHKSSSSSSSLGSFAAGECQNQKKKTNFNFGKYTTIIINVLYRHVL